MVTFGRVVVDELVNSPLLTSMGFTSLIHIIRPLCRKNLQTFGSEIQEEDKALKGLVLCLAGAGEIIVFRVWREWRRRVKRPLAGGGGDRRGKNGKLDSGAMARSRRAGPGGPAQARGPAPQGWLDGAESGSLRERDLVGVARVEVGNWVRLVCLQFPRIPIRAAGRGGVRIPGWRGGSCVRPGPGSAGRGPRCEASG